MPTLSAIRFPWRLGKRPHIPAALSTPASIYQYSPLNEEAQEIRLLRLLPGTFSSEIRVCMETTRMTEDFVPDFEALSYAWGSSENPVNIFLGESGNHTLAVTQNLAEALPYLRYKDRARVLWIDAISVNQQDLAERSSQVRRMADIYSKASQVLVWLGPASIDSSVALDCIKLVSSKVTVDWDRYALVALSDEAHWTNVSTHLPFDREEFLALCNFLKRDWFGRLWIWQEVRLAKKALILCGTESIPWTTLGPTVFCLWIKYQPDHVRDNILRSQKESLFRLCDTRKSTNFLQLIDYTKHSLCSDDKDRIFAILSLLNGGEEALQIVPDYTKSHLEVYQEVVIRYIKQFRMLHIVNAVEWHEDARGASWVPDWSVPRIAKPIEHTLASGISAPRMTFKGDGILQVTGIAVSPILVSESFNLGQLGHYTLKNCAIELHRINKRMDLEGFVNESPGNLKELTRVLCSNDFASTFFPSPVAAYPFVENSETTLRDLLKTLSDPQLDMEFFTACDTIYLEYVWMYCRGRNLFRSADGRMGLGPRGMKPGDLISVWLGCNSVMILRPTGFGQYLVIGEAYCSGLVDGSAFLGPLPDSVELVTRYFENFAMYRKTCINRASGEFYREDPRLEGVALPEGWRRKEHADEEYLSWFVNDSTGEDIGNFDPRLSPEALESRGIKLQVFDLV